MAMGMRSGMDRRTVGKVAEDEGVVTRHRRVRHFQGCCVGGYNCGWFRWRGGPSGRPCGRECFRRPLRDPDRSRPWRRVETRPGNRRRCEPDQSRRREPPTKNIKTRDIETLAGGDELVALFVNRWMHVRPYAAGSIAQPSNDRTFAPPSRPLDADHLRLAPYDAVLDRHRQRLADRRLRRRVGDQHDRHDRLGASWCGRFCMIASSEICRSPMRVAIVAMVPGRSNTVMRT